MVAPLLAVAGVIVIAPPNAPRPMNWLVPPEMLVSYSLNQSITPEARYWPVKLGIGDAPGCPLEMYVPSP